MIHWEFETDHVVSTLFVDLRPLKTSNFKYMGVFPECSITEGVKKEHFPNQSQCFVAFSLRTNGANSYRIVAMLVSLVGYLSFVLKVQDVSGLKYTCSTMVCTWYIYEFHNLLKIVSLEDGYKWHILYTQLDFSSTRFSAGQKFEQVNNLPFCREQQLKTWRKITWLT